MDATRSNFDFLVKAIKVALEAKAKTINIGDTVGYITPDEFHKLISNLLTYFPNTCFSIHCHNDLGLATANALAALQAGARQVECTINGIGERAGNTAMEEIVMAIKVRKDFYNMFTNINSTKIYNISRTISAMTGFPIQKNKAIVGLNAFSHESGVHQDGYLKDRTTYEIMDPAEIGLTHSNLVIGKHSGRAALRDKMIKLGVNLDNKQLNNVFSKLKKLFDYKKNLSDQELMDIVQDKKFILSQKRIVDFSFGIKFKEGLFLGKIYLILQNGKIIKSKETGRTAMEALIKAINKGLKINPKLQSIENRVFCYTEHDKAESILCINYNDILYTESASNKDPLKCAIQAYIYAVNKLFL
jgi:2-isopropylmalate synthase